MRLFEHLYKITFFALICSFSFNLTYAQKKLLILGSSTSSCFGPSIKDSCYVLRIKNYVEEMGQNITIDNRAFPGNSVFKAMPTGYIPPQGRDLPDTQRNITAGLSAYPAPDVVLVNFPSNYYDVYSESEVMNCLRIIKQTANFYGKPCFITTTQPRQEGAIFKTAAVRKKMANLKDSILSEFGPFAINFWDGIVNPKDTTILPQYNSGDGIHLNNAGHRMLFARIRDAHLFISNTILSNKLIDLRATTNKENIVLDWTVNNVNHVDKFVIERRLNAGEFKAIKTIENNSNYSTSSYKFIWEDEAHLAGKIFYRIKVVFKDKVEVLSPIVDLTLNQEMGYLKIYSNPIINNKLNLKVNVAKKGKYVLKLVDYLGREFYEQVSNYETGTNFDNKVLPSSIPHGTYKLLLLDNSGIICSCSIVM